jgi:hypothetical protein
MSGRSGLKTAYCPSPRPTFSEASAVSVIALASGKICRNRQHNVVLDDAHRLRCTANLVPRDTGGEVRACG